jgi:quinoprotein glucose dehydrogenase
MPKSSKIAVAVLGAVVCTANLYVAQGASSKTLPADKTTQSWETYGGQPAGDHYSSLRQINRSNVRSLVVAWKFDTGEVGGLETNPIVVGKVLYATTPSKSVIALDGETGKLIWKWDADFKGFARNRGVTYWSDGNESRIFVGYRSFLFALDAKTGKLIADFGEDGKIDLRKGLRGDDYEAQSVGLTTPGTIYKDLIIVGGQNPETYPSPPGDIRAFDVHTGKLRWTFHTIPHPGELGYETWPKEAWKTAGAANNWAGMTVDTKRGIVYVPTGSAVFDFYGGFRVGNDLFADTLLALDAETGKRLWHFQSVHHDLWDRDFSAAPALVTLKRDGKLVDAVAQTSKTGYLYVFDRVTGKPLFPIVEKPFPASMVPGEVASPTQPIPTLPAPYTRQFITEDMLTNLTPESHAWAEKQWKSMAGGGEFQPPSVDKLTADLPGFAGGAEWGGPAVDPTTGILYVNENNTSWLVGLTVPPPPGSEGEKTYQSQCSVCHGINRAGSPPSIPSLRGIDGKISDQEIADTIHGGKGRMPAFTNLSDKQIQEVVRYISKAPQQGEFVAPPKPGEAQHVATPSNDLMPYKTIGFRRFTDPDGYPAIVPPWGTLNAIDLNTGKYLWKIPFGQYPELEAKGIHNTGSDNYGGPVVTAGGLLFIGATVFDQKFHAYDSHTGELLWETELPFSGLATPSTYSIKGKQYVVIAAGGGQSSRKKSGGVYVAFALP